MIPLLHDAPPVHSPKIPTGAYGYIDTPEISTALYVDLMEPFWAARQTPLVHSLPYGYGS